jgi:hypothetical protein
VPEAASQELGLGGVNPCQNEEKVALIEFWQKSDPFPFTEWAALYTNNSRPTASAFARQQVMA